MELMRPLLRPEQVPLSRTGTVLTHLDANEYTYLEVDEDGRRLWLAAPRTAVADGARIRFPDGVAMKDFYSKLLRRSFDAVLFVRAVEPVER